MNGMWSDYIKREEAEFTKTCACELMKDENWKDFLSNKQIKNAINIKPDEKRTESNLIAVKSAMFEIRIAYLTQQSGLKAEYEFNPNEKNKKTVDFRVYGEKINIINLLMELSSLRESKIQKDKTWSVNKKNEPVFFGCALEGNDDVSEYFKAQKILVEKAAKFPDKIIGNQFSIILLDMRASMLECCDQYDFYNILYGSKNLDSHAQCYTKDNKLFSGIFCHTHPGYSDTDLVHLRKSIHYFGFVVEKDYTQDELPAKIQWFKNSSLITNDLLDLKLREIFNGKNL